MKKYCLKCKRVFSTLLPEHICRDYKLGDSVWVNEQCVSDVNKIICHAWFGTIKKIRDSLFGNSGNIFFIIDGDPESIQYKSGEWRSEDCLELKSDY